MPIIEIFPLLYFLTQCRSTNCVFCDKFPISYHLQIVVWRFLHRAKGSDVLGTKQALVIIVFIQYIPRFVRFIPLTSELKKTAGVFAETAWAGAAYYLLWFLLASHVSILESLSGCSLFITQFSYLAGLFVSKLFFEETNHSLLESLQCFFCSSLNYSPWTCLLDQFDYTESTSIYLLTLGKWNLKASELKDICY